MTMRVFTAVFHLHLQSRTLKEKRGIVKSILSRARNEFNLAAAEVEDQDIPGSAILAFVTVTTDGRLGRSILQRLEEKIVTERLDVEVVAVDVEER